MMLKKIIKDKTTEMQEVSELKAMQKMETH